jgi:GNAT superfamily N-acetyltransferase
MLPPGYTIRPATLDDLDVLVHQRIAMFSDMGRTFDEQAVRNTFDEWLRRLMPQGVYRAWLVEDATAAVVSGGGITIIPWPPGPQYLGGRLAFVYNVYTERGHRGRGLARAVMAAIHAWCRGEGVTSLALNASVEGQPLYDSLGYVVTPSPMMFFALE